MTNLNNTHTKYEAKLLLTIIIVLCFIFGGGFYILKQFNITNNKDAIVKLTPDFIEAIQKYEELGKFSEGYAAVCKDDKWGYINTKGKEIVPCQYSDVNLFHEGYAAVCKDDKWGFINTKGEEVTQFQYSGAHPFHEGYAAVCKGGKGHFNVDGKWGYINPEGKEIIQCQYSDVHSFHEGYAAVCKDDKWGFINTKGEEVTQFQYSRVSDFGEKYVMVGKGSRGYCNKGEKWGLINKGEEIVPCQYSQVCPFHEGYAAVCKDGKWGYINAEGKEIIQCQYSYASSFSEGYAIVVKHDKDEWSYDDKWGFINKDGKEIVPCQYSYVNLFHEGYAAVCKDDKWGYINTNGKEAIPVNIEAKFVGDFSEGLAFVYKVDEDGEDSFFVIDTIGNTVFSGNVNFSWTFEEVDISEMPRYFRGKLYVPIAQYKSIVYDNQGNKIKEIYECAYDNKCFTDKNSDKEYFIFRRGNGDNENIYSYLTVGLKNIDGKELIPAIYASINDYSEGHYTKVSNGVVLVTLCEVGERVDWDVNETSFTPLEGKFHYGYADLEGNDTFSDELKKRCKESYEQKLNDFYQKDLEEKQRLIREGPDWLQGAWRMQLFDDYGRHLGYLYEVFNHGTSTTYMNGKRLFERTYTVSDDKIIYEKGDNFQLDNVREKVISANGKNMQKVSHDTSYSPEREYVLQLYKLNDKGKELLDELSLMRANGCFDPFRVMYIKQNLIRYKDEQIDIASDKLGDSELARKYIEQKRILLLSLRRMGI